MVATCSKRRAPEGHRVRGPVLLHRCVSSDRDRSHPDSEHSQVPSRSDVGRLNWDATFQRKKGADRRGPTRLHAKGACPTSSLAFELFSARNPVVGRQGGRSSRLRRSYSALMSRNISAGQACVSWLVGRINGVYGTLEYSPDPLHQPVRFPRVTMPIAIYHLADACLRDVGARRHESRIS